MLMNYLTYLVFSICFLRGSTATRSFFKRCDRNTDGVLTLSEFEQCFYFADDSLSKSETVIRSDIAGLFAIVDSDKDGAISVNEYNILQQQLTKQRAMAKTAREVQYAEDGTSEENLYTDNRKSVDDEITVKMRDGTVKSLKKEEFFSTYQNLQQPLDGFHRTKNNQLLREYEKTASMEEIRAKDPTVARAIKLAEWSLLFLKYFRVLTDNCKLVRLASVPLSKSGAKLTDEELMSQKDELDYDSLRIDLGNKDFFSIIIRMFLSCGDISRVLEINVEYSKAKYINQPHLGIVSAHELLLSDPDNVNSEFAGEVPVELPDRSVVEVTTIEGLPFIEFHSIRDKREKLEPENILKSISSKRFIKIADYRVSIDIAGYVAVVIVCFSAGFLFMQARAPAYSEMK